MEGLGGVLAINRGLEGIRMLFETVGTSIGAVPGRSGLDESLGCSGLSRDTLGVTSVEPEASF